MVRFLRVLSLVPALLATTFARAVPATLEHVTSNIEARAGYPFPPSTFGRLFLIDGKPQYFSGVNAWWLGHLWTNSNVDQAISQIVSSGFKVARVWGFGTTNDPNTEYNIYYQTLNSSGQYFNLSPLNGIPRLDYVIQRAEKTGLKLILPLLNYFDDLGGINTYTHVFGGDTNSFYTNMAAQDAFKKYVKFVVERYKKSEAVFSWELCNEPRCRGCDTSVITKWATDVSSYIKGIDGRHMVSLGDEGWLTPKFAGGDGSYAYSAYEGVDFEANLGIRTLDFGTVHLYPNQWGYNYSWGNTWIAQHNALGKKYNKPILLEEYAAPTPELRKEFVPQWQDTVFKQTSIAGDMAWQFGTKFADGSNPYDEYAVYYDSNPQSEFQSLLVKQAKRMTGKVPIANQ